MGISLSNFDRIFDKRRNNHVTSHFSKQVYPKLNVFEMEFDSNNVSNNNIVLKNSFQ